MAGRTDGAVARRYGTKPSPFVGFRRHRCVSPSVCSVACSGEHSSGGGGHRSHAAPRRPQFALQMTRRRYRTSTLIMFVGRHSEMITFLLRDFASFSRATSSPPQRPPTCRRRPALTSRIRLGEEAFSKNTVVTLYSEMQSTAGARQRRTERCVPSISTQKGIFTFSCHTLTSLSYLPSPSFPLPHFFPHLPLLHFSSFPTL